MQNWVGRTVSTPKKPRLRALRAHCAQAMSHAERWALCRVTVRIGCVVGCVAICAARRVVAPRSRYKICIATRIPVARSAHRVARAAACVAALLRRIAAVSHAVSRHKAAPPPRYKICIATHPSGQAMRRCAAARPTPHAQAGGVAAPCWPCRGALLAVSWRSGARPTTLCQDTISCIMTQHQNGQ